MSDEPNTPSVAELQTQLRHTQAMTEVALKAAISALSGLEMALQTMRLQQQHSTAPLREVSLAQAEEHTRRGLALLKAAIEGSDDVGG